MLTRRAVLIRLGLAGTGGALASVPPWALASRASAQDASPAAMASHPIVGTWIVDRIPDDPTEMPTTNIYTADGGLIDTAVGAAGVWEATGPRTLNFTLIVIIPEGGYVVVRGSQEVDEAGDSATVSYSDTVVAPDGTIVDQSTDNSARNYRLRVEPQDAVGNPLSNFPAWTPAPAVTPAS